MFKRFVKNFLLTVLCIFILYSLFSILIFNKTYTATRNNNPFEENIYKCDKNEECFKQDGKCVSVPVQSTGEINYCTFEEYCETLSPCMCENHSCKHRKDNNNCIDNILLRKEIEDEIKTNGNCNRGFFYWIYVLVWFYSNPIEYLSSPYTF